MRVRIIDTTNLKLDENFVRFSSQLFSDLVSIVNGKLTFADNLDCEIVSVTILTANTEQSIPHKLGRLPVGYINVGASTATTVYDGTSKNTTAVIYLRATTATTVRLLIF